MTRRLGPLWCLFLCLLLLTLPGFAQRREPDAERDKPSAAQQRKEHDGPEQIQKRQDWFYRQRAFPQKRIPPGARLNGLRQMETMIREQERAGAASGLGLTANSSTWTLIGPQTVNPFADDQSGAPNATGRITALAVDPRNANVVYAGAAQGGVWKSTDGGQNWTPLTDQQPSLAIGAIAIAPSAPDTIYVGTGEFNQSLDAYYGVGVLKSTNGGASWTYLPGSFAGPLSSGFFGDGGGAYFGAIAVHPTDPNIVLASVFKETQTTELSGVYRSTDGGQNWTRVLNGFTFNVAFDPTGANAYTGLGYCNSPGNDCFPSNLKAAGFYKSTDSGATWNKLNNFGLAANNTFLIGRVALGVAPSSATTLFAAVGDSADGGSDGVFKSIDGGNTWSTVFSGSNNFCGPQCDYDLVLGIHPTSPNTVFIGGSSQGFADNGIGMFFRSLNGGAFTEVSGNVGTLAPVRLHVDQHAIAFSADGSKMYVGNDGGVWSTPDALNPNVTWTSLNANLPTLQFYPGIAVSPANVNFILGGTQDNSTLRFTGSPAWDEVTCGDGAYNLIDPNTPSTVYVSCLDDGSVQKSVQSGDAPSWVNIVGGINPNENSLVAPLVMDPANSSRLFYGKTRVYRSDNAGATWAPISPPILSVNASSFDAITTLASSPLDSNLLFVGTSEGLVAFTRNALSSSGYTLINGFPGRWITNISVSPRNGTAYVAVSGFSGFSDTVGHVFSVTLNGNTPTVTDISSNLPNIPVNDVIVDPDVDNTLYIGTDIGVFFTTNNGASWAALSNGLPRAAVMGLRLHRATRTLIAATHGRSMWALISPVVAANNPVPALTSLVPNFTTAGSGAFNLTVNGSNFVAGASTVQWNGSNRTTTFVNSGQLTAAITAADVASAGSFPVTVVTSAPGGGTSNGLIFTVNPAVALVPTLNSISPGTVVANSGGFTLTVNGANFTNASVVSWNGAARATTFVSSTQLTAAILPSDVSAAGTAGVSVFTPAPGGGTSTLVTFFITVGNTVPASLPQARYWPHIVSGGGFLTKMTVTNLTNAPNDVLIYFTSQAGQTIKTTSVHLTGAGTARMATLQSDRFAASQTQWAIVNSQANVTINLFFEFIADPNTLAIVNTVGFNDAPPLTAFTVPVEFEPPPGNFNVGRTIGVAFANPNNTQATVTIKLLDSSGNIIGTLNRNVPAFGQIAFALETTPEFSAVLPNANFLGSIAVTSTQPVSAIALEDDLGPFSAIPVVSGTAK